MSMLNLTHSDFLCRESISSSEDEAPPAKKMKQADTITSNAAQEFFSKNAPVVVEQPKTLVPFINYKVRIHRFQGRININKTTFDKVIACLDSDAFKEAVVQSGLDQDERIKTMLSHFRHAPLNINKDLKQPSQRVSVAKDDLHVLLEFIEIIFENKCIKSMNNLNKNGINNLKSKIRKI